ncbi:hypothetical protein MUP77_06605 [Candidatus Bathyarchaeota archaeon]|nr:hypothetical protein [Candidatus Bathyarchaeota archaeon]
MTRYLPRNLILKKLQQRFERLNPDEEWYEVDLDNIDYPCDYGEALIDTADANSDFKWYDDSDPLHLDPQKPWPTDEDLERLQFEEELEKHRSSIRVELKLYFQKSKKGEKYAYVKGTIGKKLFKKYGERLFKEVILDWPLYGIAKDEQEQDAPNALFDEKKVDDEEAEEYQEHPSALFDSPDESKKEVKQENPFPENTDKYRIAKALIEGETNRVKMVRELGVSINTIYNVTGDLTTKGYVLAIQQKPKKPITPSSSSSTSSHRTHQRLVPGDFSSEESSEFTQNEDDETSENGVENLTGDTRQLTGELRNEEMSESRRRRISPVSDKNISVTPESLRAMMKGIMLEMSRPAEVEKLPGISVPVEEVELVGEKINYKVALNPEIFYRYSVFKARAEALGNKWDGDFSDFLDIATKDVLTVHGLYPTVLTVGKSGKMLVEIPMSAQQGGE